MKHLDEQVLGYEDTNPYSEGKTRYWKCIEDGKIIGYVQANETLFDLDVCEAWTNWYKPDGRFVNSLERIESVSEYAQWANTQNDMVEIKEEDFPKEPK